MGERLMFALRSSITIIYNGGQQTEDCDAYSLPEWNESYHKHHTTVTVCDGCDLINVNCHPIEKEFRYGSIRFY